MASSDPNHSFPGSGLWRRPVASSSTRPPAGGPLRPDIDPPPRPRPLLQLFAFGLILFLACLQFLPATHFRHPSDPLRSWIPFDPNRTAAMSTKSRATDGEQSNNILSYDIEAAKIHIFSWSNCLDLRVLAVLVNSTLSSSRFPERVHLHFFIPEGEDEKSSYYKLKVLFTHSNLDIIGQKEVKEKLRTVSPEGEHLWPSFHEITPFIIPHINPSWNRYIYISPDSIIKGKIEELFAMDLGHYGLSVAEDCSRRLVDFVNIDVLSAIQRTTAKPWVSKKPYDTNACSPDLNVLLVDANKLEKNLLEAIRWWSRVLNLGEERSGQIYPAIALALYNNYLNLSSAWQFGDSTQSKLDDEAKVLRFDGPRRVCPGFNDRHQTSNFSNIWQQYLPPNSEAVLNH